MNWKPLQSVEQIAQIRERSKEIPCMIFKHSIRCSISSVAKARLSNQWNFGTEQVEAYYLDLINFRAVSNEVARTFEVYHESPQVLLLQDGNCIYDASHLDISVGQLEAELGVVGKV